jgi:hypothetical protein
MLAFSFESLQPCRVLIGDSQHQSIANESINIPAFDKDLTNAHPSFPLAGTAWGKDNQKRLRQHAVDAASPLWSERRQILLRVCVVLL